MFSLIVDAGNTQIKLFLFRNNEITYKMIFVTDEDALTFLVQQGFSEKISACIVAKVRDISKPLTDYLSVKFNAKYFSVEMHLPVKITYNTPLSLGQDRIAAVSGASVLFPEQNVLVIDSGTAITFDILQKDSIYLGGTISPGLLTRFKSLHTFTGKLPLLDINKDKQDLFGKTTDDAIICGVQNGILHEVTGVIADFERKFEGLTVVFTGGDSFFFDKLLKNRIFVEPNLTAIGLNKILELNV